MKDFGCIACNDNKPAGATFCTDCRALRSEWSRRCAPSQGGAFRYCRGCHARLTNFEYAPKVQRCYECQAIEKAKNNDAVDVYGAARRYLAVAANDNAPATHKTCAACECQLPLDDFKKKPSGLYGVEAKCRDCVNALKRATDRTAEYERRRQRQTGKDSVTRLRIRRIDAWQARRASEGTELDKRIGDYLKNFRLTVEKPWLRPGLTVVERQRIRRNVDEAYKIRCRMRCRMRSQGIKGYMLPRMRQALNAKYATPRRKGMEALLGYTIEELRSHLEAQFTDGMTWDAFRKGEIHIDHIKPLNTFDKTDVVQMEVAWSLSNLRPLWAKHNMCRPCKSRRSPPHLRDRGSRFWPLRTRSPEFRLAENTKKVSA